MGFPPNTFCWVELGTSDARGARDFYSNLLGWSADTVDMGEAGTYTLLKMEGKDIAGLYTLNEDQKREGVPPHWLSYVRVDDADRSARKAKELGGTVLMGPFEVPNVGRMAIARDPADAVFALFQAGDHEGAAPMDNKPGMFCWNELATRDADTAKRFYTELFGWTADDSPGPMGGTYTMFANGGRLAGGMLQISEEMGDVPSNWLVYFAVDDCDEATETAAGGCGNVIMPPTDIPEIGRFSVLTDPQGAAFAMIKLSRADEN